MEKSDAEEADVRKDDADQAAANEADDKKDDAVRAAKTCASVDAGKCHTCSYTAEQYELKQCVACDFLFCATIPCYFLNVGRCKECAPTLLRDVTTRLDQMKWWVHTRGEGSTPTSATWRRALLNRCRAGLYLQFNEEGQCINDPVWGSKIMRFNDTLSLDEVDSTKTLMIPFMTAAKQHRDTANGLEMDKYRQSFALLEAGGLVKPGGDNQRVVDAKDLLDCLKTAVKQDTAHIFPQLPERRFLATADVSSTHDSDHKLIQNGSIKYEMLIQGSAWYIFELPGEPDRIVEVRAGSSIVLQGGLNYFRLRTDLGRPGPAVLLSNASKPLFAVSVTYGGTLPVEQVPPTHTVDKSTSRPLNAFTSDAVSNSAAVPHAAKVKHKKGADPKVTHQKDNDDEDAAAVHEVAKVKRTQREKFVEGDRYFLADAAQGGPIGPFQPTESIQSRTAGSPLILPGTVFTFQDHGYMREVHIVVVGRYAFSTGTVQRVIIARTRAADRTSAWDPMKVVSANQVPSTSTRTHAHTHT